MQRHTVGRLCLLALLGVPLGFAACKQSSTATERSLPVATTRTSTSVVDGRVGNTPVVSAPAPATTRATTSPATKPFAAIDNPHLHNAHRVTDKLISGAQPDDEDGFKALRDLGVRTIISVDGSKPDVALARKYGMQYVHRPTRYDGVAREDAIAVAKAIETYPGLVYLHCHHGRHRSAATLAVACVYAGMIAPEQAETVLATFGTGKNYTGLWQAARDARPLEPDVLARAKVNFVETAETPAMAQAMVSVDMHWDHLKLLQKNKWQPLAAHADLDPAHEALQLQEQLHETGRTEGAKGHPANFQQMLQASEKAAAELSKTLRAKPLNTPRADVLAKEIGTSCTTCHKAYRD